MSEDHLIRDIPSIKKTLDQMNALRVAGKAMPLARPLLKLLNVDTDKIEESLADVDELARQYAELANLPDRFNDAFSSDGWIIHDLMNAEVAKEALERADSGDMAGADEILVEYYNGDTIKWQLRALRRIAVFRPRIELTEKALVDYIEGRFHASVPVVLAQLDGMVNDLHEKQKGFFSEATDLQAWDSIAGHSKGLNALAQILRAGRRKTTTEQITIPYRNGIIHGRDLGYDNRIVAAKTWAALFATGEWAAKAEAGILDPQESEPDPSFRDILTQVRRNQAEKERLNSWKPRGLRPEEDFLKTGASDDYQEGTPERKLAEFLTLWQARNYGFMAKCLSTRLGPGSKEGPARVREVYEDTTLVSYEFLAVVDKAAALTEVESKLVTEKEGERSESTITFRLTFEDAEGGGTTRGQDGGSWKVINWDHWFF